MLLLARRAALTRVLCLCLHCLLLTAYCLLFFSMDCVYTWARPAGMCAVLPLLATRALSSFRIRQVSAQGYQSTTTRAFCCRRPARRFSFMATCSKCGATVAEQKAFCQDCGAPMNPQARTP